MLYEKSSTLSAGDPAEVPQTACDTPLSGWPGWTSVEIAARTDPK